MAEGPPHREGTFVGVGVSVGVGVNVWVGVTVIVDVAVIVTVFVGVTAEFNAVPQLEAMSMTNTQLDSNILLLIERLERWLIGFMDASLKQEKKIYTTLFIQQNPIKFCSR